MTHLFGLLVFFVPRLRMSIEGGISCWSWFVKWNSDESLFVNVVMRNNATLFYEKKMKHLVGLFGGWHFSVLFLYVRSSPVFFARIGWKKRCFLLFGRYVKIYRGVMWRGWITYVVVSMCHWRARQNSIERTHEICSHFIRLVLSVTVSGDRNEFNKAVRSSDVAGFLWSMGFACRVWWWVH